MRIVVLDTNALWPDVLLAGPTMAALLNARVDEDFELAIPGVVADEVLSQYESRAAEYSKAIGDASRNLQALGIDVTGGPSAPDPGFPNTFRRRFAELGVAILAHPPIDLPIRWAILRRKPFKPNGAGLPDALIWATVLELVKAGRAVTLVTANSKDFWNDPAIPGLAADLQADLEDVGADKTAVIVVRSPRDLIPQTPGAFARANAILADAASRDRLANSLTELVSFDEIPAGSLDLGVHLDSDPQSIGVEIRGMELLGARALGEDQLSVDLSADADLLLSILIFRGDLYVADDNPKISVTDWEWNDHYVEAETSLSARITIEATIGSDGNAFSAQVVDASRPWSEES